MNKLENLIDMARLNELLGKKEEEKKSNTVLWVLAVIGAVAAVGQLTQCIVTSLPSIWRTSKTILKMSSRMRTKKQKMTMISLSTREKTKREKAK